MSSFDDILPFFDDNGAARDLVALNYIGCFFEKAISIDDIDYEPMLQAMLVKNYETKTLPNGATMEDDGIHYEITDLIRDTATFHAEIDAHGTNAASPAGEKLRSQAFGNFGNFSDDVRKFYVAFLNVVKDGQQIDFNTAITSSDPSHIRINLKKAVEDEKYKNNILFGETLPPVPESVSKIYFSDGSVWNKSTAGNSWDRALKQLYNDTYLAASQSYLGSRVSNRAGNGFGFNVRNSLKGGARRQPNSHLNLYFKAFVKNCIMVHAKKTNRPRVKSGKSYDHDFDDLYVNLENGIKYVRIVDQADPNKEEKLYRINPDGSRVDVGSNDQLDKDLAKNCGVGYDDKQACRMIHKCLLSGNKRNLTECLKFYETKDMFQQAQREVATMNPKIALLLLETFGFTPKKDTKTGFILPPTFEDWSLNILPRTKLPEETISQIKSNYQLMQYLRSVVNIIRANPSILNPNPKPSKYSKCGAELQIFYEPSMLKDCDMKNMSNHVLQQSILLSRPLIPVLPMPLGMNFGNVSNQIQMPPVFNGAYRMSGGGSSKYDADCVNACALENTFKFTLDEMERNGKMLVDEDKDRIFAVIDKVARREKQLLQLLDDIRLFTTLNKVNPQSSQVSDITLDEIAYTSRNAREAGDNNITQMALNNLNQSTTQTINDIAKYAFELLKVQQPLADIMAGRSSTFISRVN